MNKFRIYIPFGQDVGLLSKCVESIATRIEKFSLDPTPICIINNTLKSVLGQIPYPEKCLELIPPVELQHAQEINWAIKTARENGEPFCMALHTDAELVDGALEDILERWQEATEQGIRWAQILQFESGVFSMVNLDFFYTENVWFDAFLFPFYYMDNHMYNIIEARGWKVLTTRLWMKLILPHKSSHYLKDNLVFRRKNDLAFRRHGDLFADIWGGLPGHETNKADRTASGTLPT
jgi:hypothetical protein